MASDDLAGGETAARILAATWKLMGGSADLKVRLADIAAEAGVSRQAVYLHFGNRANLLLAAVQYRDRTTPSGAIRRAAVDDPVPLALDTFVAAWFEHIPRIQPVAQLLAAAAQTDAEARVAFEDRMELMRRLTGVLARRLSAAGLLREEWTVEAAADWIWHRTHLDGWRHLVAERGWDAAAYAARVAASLRGDLLASAGPTA